MTGFLTGSDRAGSSIDCELCMTELSLRELFNGGAAARATSHGNRKRLLRFAFLTAFSNFFY